MDPLPSDRINLKAKAFLHFYHEYYAQYISAACFKYDVANMFSIKAVTPKLTKLQSLEQF